MTTDMMISSTPPTQAQMHRYDAEWNGVAHRNVCVRIKDGAASVEVAGMPQYTTYFVSTPAAVLVREVRDTPDGTTAHLHIETPDDQTSRAWVCLGIGTSETR